MKYKIYKPEGDVTPDIVVIHNGVLLTSYDEEECTYAKGLVKKALAEKTPDGLYSLRWISYQDTEDELHIQFRKPEDKWMGVVVDGIKLTLIADLCDVPALLSDVKDGFVVMR